MADDTPNYNLYRQGRMPRRGDGPGRGLRDLRTQGRGPRRLRVGRIIKLICLAIAGWLLLSLVLFVISAETSEHEPSSTTNALSPGGSLLTGSTILVLSTDTRPPNSKEPGANEGPPHSDSMILARAGLGSVRRLSVLRDSYAQIPGDGAQKINAAYAMGGPGLSAKTVENFMGNDLKVNHLVEFSFVDFPQFIDTLGGIDVSLNECVQSQPFDGQVFQLPPGTSHLSGKQALLFSRVRENKCNPREDDRARVARQQTVLTAVRSKLITPTAFFKLPWISWQAPRTIKTDLGPFGLLAFAADLGTGGSTDQQVLQPYSLAGPDGSVLVAHSDRDHATQWLLGH
jgi:LCP family protein required for cell wall assembly